MKDTTTSEKVVVPLTGNEGVMPLASSGTIVNNFRTGYKVQISWTVNSQNVANNTSNVTAKVQLVSTGSAYTISSSATKNGSLTMNGTTYNFTFTAGLSGNQTKTVFTKTIDVPHNSDGTKTLSMSATLGINVTLSGKYWGNVTASGSGVLNTIPRTSSISLSASSVNFGSAITVNISRASTAFTHKVYYVFGSKTVTVSTSATTSASYTIPNDHMNEIPNSTSGTATIYVDTYSGSTFIGTVGKSFTVNVPSTIVPSFDTTNGFTASTVADGAPTSLGYVKGKSKCKLTINGAKGSYGSTIKSYSISGGGFSTTASSFTTGTLNTAGSITFTAKITDSRGRTASKTTSITVNDYFAPTFAYPTVFRCTSSGAMDENNGTYIKVKFEYSNATIVDGKVTNKVEYKATSNTSWINAGSVSSASGIVFGGGAISTSSSYDVRLTLSDTISTVTQIFTIGTAYAVLDIRKGGKGIAIGKASETDGLFDIGMNLKVKGNGNTQISSTGKSVSWLAGCKGDGAIINMTSQSGYSPILRQKTTNGAWAMGVYTNDIMYLTYMTDTNINAGTNTPTAQYAFPANVSGTVYTTGNKPTPSAIGALPTSGGTLTGAVKVSGESVFHNGTYSDPWVNTACAIKTTGNVGIGGSAKINGALTLQQGANIGYSVYVGSDSDTTYRMFSSRRLTSGVVYQARLGASYKNSVKLTSSSTAALRCGAMMSYYTGGASVRGVLITQDCFIPDADNNTQCGTSSNRWSAVYASTGTVYSSSKDEKEDIESLNIVALSEDKKSIKDVIKDGIKNTPMYSYKYKTVSNNDTFVGFLGQELEEQNKEFFNLIGSSYETEEGKIQYDIREASVIGVLWSALQDVLSENERQEERIKELETKVESLTNEIQQIKDILSNLA